VLVDHTKFRPNLSRSQYSPTPCLATNKTHEHDETNNLLFLNSILKNAPVANIFKLKMLKWWQYVASSYLLVTAYVHSTTGVPNFLQSWVTW